MIFHCEEGLTLSKASLGRFTFELLKRKGRLYNYFVLYPQYNRSLVCASIELPEEQKEGFEKAAKVKLRLPPRIVLNANQ